MTYTLVLIQLVNLVQFLRKSKTGCITEKMIGTNPEILKIALRLWLFNTKSSGAGVGQTSTGYQQDNCIVNCGPFGIKIATIIS